MKALRHQVRTISLYHPTPRVTATFAEGKIAYRVDLSVKVRAVRDSLDDLALSDEEKFQALDDYIMKDYRTLATYKKTMHPDWRRLFLHAAKYVV